MLLNPGGEGGEGDPVRLGKEGGGEQGRLHALLPLPAQAQARPPLNIGSALPSQHAVQDCNMYRNICNVRWLIVRLIPMIIHALLPLPT